MIAREYRSYTFQSADGLHLFARDYYCAKPVLNLLCLHGLTRNSADFAALCDQLPANYRIIVPDQRGRGRSAYDPKSENYQLPIYVSDTALLIEQLKLTDLVVIGTSMGGLMAMLLAVTELQSTKLPRIIGLVLNDIGPEVESEGLQRIKTYGGKSVAFDTWEQAINYVKSVHSVSFPNFSDEQWLAFAKNLIVEGPSGKLMFAYDKRIMEPIFAVDENAAPADLWPLYQSICHIPSLIIRGELSDVLARSCVAKMHSLNASLRFTEVPNVGHAPTLVEPDSFVAINEFLHLLTK